MGASYNIDKRLMKSNEDFILIDEINSRNI